MIIKRMNLCVFSARQKRSKGNSNSNMQFVISSSPLQPNWTGRIYSNKRHLGIPRRGLGRGQGGMGLTCYITRILNQDYCFFPNFSSTRALTSCAFGTLAVLPLFRISSISCMISRAASSNSLSGSLGSPSIGCEIDSWLIVRAAAAGLFRFFNFRIRKPLPGLAKKAMETATARIP
jgi:hypothetical protein